MSFLTGSGREASQPERKPLNRVPPRDFQAVPSSMISRGSVLPSVPGALTRSAAVSANFDDF
jgi:hypothetical protein